MGVLRLVADEVSAGRWLWRLSDGDHLVESHQVVVDDRAWEWQAFRDLDEEVSRAADPGRPMESEAELVARVGAWAAEHVLGVLANELAERSPVTVVVEVPSGSEWLLGLPLGMAVVDGRALVLRRVVFVGVVAGVEAPVQEAVGDRLRVLAVFSVPAGQELLDVRRERFALQRLMHELAGRLGVGVELRVLQYGATRRKLEVALGEGAGWDVVHFSGHGAPGRLVLETEEGFPDVVGAAELVEWLEVARNRVKLVSLSSCSSAAFTVSETLRMLGVETHLADDPDNGDGGDGDARADGAGGLALELVERVRCAVVAMRYPVVDDFAIELMTGFYDSLLRAGQPVPAALAAATRAAVKVPATPGSPAVSVATPAVFGSLAVDMRLEPPLLADGPLVDDDALKMAEFLPEPSRFVGRTQVLARANQTLATRSGRSGVVLHGMAGAGKTACSLELAYGQQANFQKLVWFQCPLEGADGGQVAEAFQRFAIQLDRALGRNLVGDKLDEAGLSAVLPVVTEVMERRAVLVVVDNAESLLTAAGGWLDPRWGQLLGALTNHRGLGRVVVTTRRTPAQPLPNLTIEAIHALSPHEALLLTRQLPNLSKLLDEASHHTVLRRVLDTTKGHPKLLELADAHAGDPAGLTPFLDTANATWDAEPPQPEFLARRGDATPIETVEDYLHILDNWTTRTALGLSDPARLLLQILCAVEPDDRTTQMLDGNWDDIHTELGLDRTTSGLDGIVRELADAALIDEHPIGVDDSGKVHRRFDLHPAVANTIASGTPESVTTIAHGELAKWWNGILRGAIEDESNGEPASQLIVHAGRQAATYNVHLGQWDHASHSLEQVLHRTQNPADIADIIPQVETITVNTIGTDRELIDQGVLAQALFAAGHHDRAERIMRDVITTATATDKLAIASTTSGILANLLMDRGRYPEALAVTDEKADLTRRAGRGPWTQVADQGWRLQVLALQGRYGEVLDQATELIRSLEDLPNPPGDDENVRTYNVRETLHDTARDAAAELGDWETALSHLDQMMISKGARDAPDLEQAGALFNAYVPLLRTGRIDDAKALLQQCRSAFEFYGDGRMLGICISALADVEDELGHTDQAIANEHIALRYEYATREPASIATSHHNLANYLNTRAGTQKAGIHHRLAAGLIRALTGGDINQSVPGIAADLTALDAADIPSYEEICEQLDQVTGVRFGDLIDSFGGADDTHIERLVELAGEVDPEQLYRGQLQLWEPVLTVAVAVARGTTLPRSRLDDALQPFREVDVWSQLAATISHIVDEPNDIPRLDDLDAVDTAIVNRLIRALADPTLLDPIPEPLRPLVDVIGEITQRLTDQGSPSPDLEVLDRVRQTLDALEASDDWAQLARQMRRLTTPSPQLDWTDLDTVDTAILITTLRSAGLLEAHG